MDTRISNQKLELIEWLSSLEDQSVIEKLITFRKEETKDWWDSISAKERNAIEKGINDADDKKLNSHSEVRKIYEKWL